MYEEVYKKLGLNIKKYRVLRGLTQENLADKTSKSVNLIGKVEVAYVRPSFRTIIAIANALEIPLKDLFDFEN